MNETSKMYQRRLDRGDFTNYLHGFGIDIGCGSDPLQLPPGIHGEVYTWDQTHGNGDAMLMEGSPDGALDFVYSSHCLEHLVDLKVALTNWRRILKPGGFLYLVVPDYTLYEHNGWPSGFNGDHKHSFSASLYREKVKRENHWGLPEMTTLFRESGGWKLCVVHLEDYGYDYNLGRDVDQTLGGAVAQICYILQKPKE